MAGLVTVNGRGVLSGVLALPRVGAWHAEFEVDTTEDITGPATIRAGNVEFRGTVSRGAQYQGEHRLRIVAGGDGLRKNARPQHYVAPPFRAPLGDLLRTAGEKLSPTTSAQLLSRALQAWTTIETAIGMQIAALVSWAAPADTVWRFLPDGSVWLGQDAYAPAPIASWRELDYAPRDGRLELGLDAATLLPGTSLGPWKIDYCEHVIEAGNLRTRAWVVP